MPQKEIEELKSMFTDGSGFGDPDARRNAELRLQTLLVERNRSDPPSKSRPQQS